ncbi:hypothetical protein C4D60_Mb05t25490 [Musa balbisiana]|uniref:YABBY protein C-terminal domain-containing protein n=1 Tax=Musa balbisiana TaxID=52838 RepID=A0A4S8JYS0_MUSBA|nr:hypothetical protein C4D60_Mb05t25490 [Musa balbisiana]
MMSSSNPLLELPEQLGYVQCSFCATILLVSVPCSSLLKVVTVRCGHCTAPEKRQRAPSAYNHFIREEIVRIKAREPNVTHKEAFSAAAKNWAHFPRIQHNEDGKSCSSREGKKICDGHVDEEMHGRRNNLHQRKTPKQAACSGEET